MNQKRDRQGLGESLAAQEKRLSSDRLLKQQIALDLKFRTSAIRDRRFRLTVAVLGAATMGGMFTLWLLTKLFPKQSSLVPLFEGLPDVSVALIMALLFAVPVCFALLLMVYVLYFGPRARRLEHERLELTLREVEHQLAQLQSRMSKTTSE